jgi:hypothetical protein
MDQTIPDEKSLSAPGFVPRNADALTTEYLLGWCDGIVAIASRMGLVKDLDPQERHQPLETVVDLEQIRDGYAMWREWSVSGECPAPVDVTGGGWFCHLIRGLLPKG